MVQRDGNIQHIRVFVGSHRWGHFCKRDHSNGGTQLSCFKGEGCIVGCDASRFDNFKVSEFRRPNRKPDILESGASIAGVSQRFVATDDKNDFHRIRGSLDLEDRVNDCRNLDFGRRQSKKHTRVSKALCRSCIANSTDGYIGQKLRAVDTSTAFVLAEDCL